MKFLGQFGIILGVTFASEMIHHFIPLPIPASIYGLALMLFLLCTGVIKPHRVKEAAGFMLEIMPPMFIPAAVGLLAVWSDLKKVLLPISVITVVTTVVVMAVTGIAAQKMIRYKKKKEASS